ncbi:sensor histidine kinase [Alkalicoccobacillus gibsonii]|uniref:sensor histidine kinase n=1 Tax=Alkalicoccobacillus gibsonii TaxID=79881 RepID=UPI00235EE4C5|nr:sensor histidine kinase [Alkalicoccobacillus gibsonii]
MREHFGKTISWSLLLGIALVGVFSLLNNVGDIGSVFIAVFSFRDFTTPLIILLGIAAIVYLSTSFKLDFDWFEDNSMRGNYKKISLDVRFIFLAVTLFIDFLLFLVAGLDSFYSLNYIDMGFFVIFAFYIFFIWLALHQVIWLYLEIKDSSYLIEGLKQGVILRTYRTIRDAFSNIPLVLKLLFFILSMFVWGIGTIALVLAPGDLAALFFVVSTIFLGIPTLTIFLLRLGYLNQVFKQTEQLTNGTLRAPLEIKGHSFITTHAKHVNHLREGISYSMNEQAKSERMKTELITNVSHDLRTPLTSIITYTDLLKNPDLSAEERQSYVDVLARKSERLKVLIDDLFDVSKMASGQIELKKANIELKQLIQQAIVEHQEAFDQERLDLRLTMPENDLFVYVDGQKCWRMLDNLLLNVSKYSQPGTRVYLTVTAHEEQVDIVIKNISRYELSENPEELFERFKRADEARHTEGSGLGLAIAQSIAELHGGQLQLEIDGDLFKVTIHLYNQGELRSN